MKTACSSERNCKALAGEFCGAGQALFLYRSCLCIVGSRGVSFGIMGMVMEKIKDVGVFMFLYKYL